MEKVACSTSTKMARLLTFGCWHAGGELPARALKINSPRRNRKRFMRCRVSKLGTKLRPEICCETRRNSQFSVGVCRVFAQPKVDKIPARHALAAPQAIRVGGGGADDEAAVGS